MGFHGTLGTQTDADVLTIPDTANPKYLSIVNRRKRKTSITR